MTSDRFFIEKPNLDSFPEVFLSGNEHHHLSRVARVKPHEKVWLFDGQGMNYLARVEEIGPDRTRLVILETTAVEEPKVKVTLGQALLKARKMEFVLQKTTELGLSIFLPVLTERSIIRVQSGESRRIQRWQRIIREAAKQSQRTTVPSVLQPLMLAEVMNTRREEKKVFLSEHHGTLLKDILLFHSQEDEARVPSSVIILVGPEGGWTQEEEKIMLGHGYEPVSLGKSVLRAETAAISAVALVFHFWLY